MIDDKIMYNTIQVVEEEEEDEDDDEIEEEKEEVNNRVAFPFLYFLFTASVLLMK